MTCPECRAEDFTGYLTGCPCCIAMRRVQVEKANFDFLMRAIREPRKMGRPALRLVERDKARDEGAD